MNLVAHSLVRYARNVSDYVIWIEDFPPPALEAFYLDSIQFQELMNEIFFLKKKPAHPAKIKGIKGDAFPLSFTITIVLFVNFEQIISLKTNANAL